MNYPALNQFFLSIEDGGTVATATSLKHGSAQQMKSILREYLFILVLIINFVAPFFQSFGLGNVRSQIPFHDHFILGST